MYPFITALFAIVILRRTDANQPSIVKDFPGEMKNFLFLCFGCVIGVLPAMSKAEPPPPPVHSPVEQRSTFEFAERGYRIELVASEPMVQDPVVIQFDGNGRLWVVEMRGYMQDINRTGANDPIGRVSVLEDIDGDGAMDKSTIFADELVLPRSILVLPDGVLIAESKPLWFFEDTDGDLVADKKTLVDANYAKDSIEHSANGLLRAMDNWIYNAKEGHRYRRNGKKWIRGETEERGQWGICQDDKGRLFYNYNHSQLHADFVPANSLTRNPNHDPTTGFRVGVTTTNEVFPIRPNLATNRGYIPSVMDENGSLKQITSACSPLIYRENLFPEFAGNAFVCETAGNLVKRNVLKDNSIYVSGNPAYSDRDFLASTDERFRPCWLTAGPDGAIYIADMYRGIVQDGPHMSPYLREHSIQRKMDKPIHLGRVWRIVPERFEQEALPVISFMNEADLVKQLANGNGWWRDQSQMHLVERKLEAAIPAIRDLALTHSDATVRLQALWTLEGLKDSEPERLVESLRDVSPVVQAAAFRVLLNLGIPSQDLARAISEIIKTPSSDEVVLQMVLTLGDLDIEEDERYFLLQQLLIPRASDPLIRDAALSSLSKRESAFLKALWAELQEVETPNSGLSFFLESLAQAIIKSRDSEVISDLLGYIDSPSFDWKQKALMNGVGIQGAELAASPIKLPIEPEAAKYHDIFKTYFAWPGHTPAAPLKGAVRPLKKKERELFARGRQVYLTSCVACHGTDGNGMKLLAPPLAGSDWVQGSKERLARVLLHGLTGPITVSGKRYAAPDIQPVMPPLATLGNAEIAAVLTYIRREWGNTADPISSGEVNKLRIASQGRTVPWTEEELIEYKK